MKRYYWWPLCWLAGAYGGDMAGRFDYYLLALSWSPDYCASRPQDREQCSRHFGFVLHGLWPQYQRGFPANCTDEALREDIPQRFAGLYPSSKLYRHEWSKHGTCSGLGQQGYHQLAAQLKANVRIPERYLAPAQALRRTPAAFKTELAAANPWLTVASVALSCSGSGRFLQEVYVCFDRRGERAQPCGAEVLAGERRSCRQPDFLVRSVR